MTLKVHHLRPAPGAHTKKTRVGRGEGSKGKTAGRGTKGTKARYQVPLGFEGGQMPLYRRLPKRGFVPYGGKTSYAVVNLESLSGFAANAVVDPDGLAQAGLIKLSGRSRVKILGAGDVAHALTVRAHAVSESARAKIEAKGGRVETLPERVPAS
jgi:large subunit ribosomal protein L15